MHGWKISLWLLLSQAPRMQDPQRGSWGIFFSRNLRILRLWSLIRISFMITVAADHIFSSIKTILSSQLCLLWSFMRSKIPLISLSCFWPVQNLIINGSVFSRRCCLLCGRWILHLWCWCRRFQCLCRIHVLCRWRRMAPGKISLKGFRHGVLKLICMLIWRIF